MRISKLIAFEEARCALVVVFEWYSRFSPWPYSGLVGAGDVVVSFEAVGKKACGSSCHCSGLVVVDDFYFH